MKRFIGMALFASVLCTGAIAAERVAVLDGTSWKIDVEPDSMAKDKGEQDFKETLTFADGRITLAAPRVGFGTSPYSVTKSGEKEVTFKAERFGEGEGRSVWTGTIKGKDLDGKLIYTTYDGSVLTYTIKGNKLD